VPINQHLGTALTCLVWKISRTPLLVVDKDNHLSKQLLPLFYKWKALAHVKSLLPSAKGLSFTFMLSQPISLYLKQAFLLLCFIHPYVDLFNHVYYFPLFSMMLLSERIYLWKLSMIVKSLFCWAYGFCYISSVIKAPFKNKYSLFIVFWPRTKVCHHQSWFTLCIFIVISSTFCKSSYMKGSCCLLWLVPW
jgi:hypothetical protein